MGVTSASSKRSGTREWLFQRIANAAICLWAIVFISQVICVGASYEEWQQLFSPLWFKLYSSVTLLVICLNSVLAGWQIGTDYIKSPAMNGTYMLVVKAGSLIYALLGLYILWML